ncbi:CHASE2 domain-containing protein [Billgrantia endophytica]|uniref:Adenylate/guanylate cyclase domain-containing protein n=1 Tax=Billgrantia endophytica TaxID=2033802 RepID=A0A2N7U6F6_9GAMM|nr:adenylate/guanylate cyclase domain-containing protein [Halomonas endophytica]PMR76001.1 adenylate/guanylate cyclase domain-containing protein [Halomonas endophytica]
MAFPSPWNRVRWHWAQHLGALAILGAVLLETLGVTPVSLLERLEWQAYDMRVRHFLPDDADPALVIVDIDERSLHALGQWPWPRTLLADLVTALFEDHDAALLGLDVVFAEPERLPPPADGDRRLADALSAYPVVLGYYFQSRCGEGDPPSVGNLPWPVTVESDATLPVPHPERYTGNLPVLQDAAMGAGFFDNPRVDDDGVFRRVPMLQAWQGDYYPSLPLAMLMAMLGQPPVTPVIHEAGGIRQLEALDVGGFEIPVDGQGAALVPWYGPRGHFRSVSAVDVLEGRVERDELAGATLILGASAPGLMDLRSTPVGAVYPGVEINLSLLAGMLHQRFMAEPPWVAGAELVGLLLLGLLMSVLYPRLGAPLLLGFSLALAALAVGGNLWAWDGGLALPIAGMLVLVLAQTIWHLALNLLREGQQKRWVAERFGQYVPPALVKEMVDSGESFGLEGEDRELTVLFSDVRGFTSFAESIPPAELTSVMNRLLTPLTHAIHQHGGTIDKYMGDAVMAFWGAPLADANHAERALEGAWAMLAALEEVNQEFEAEGKPPLAMGVGLNSGMMSVGNMGSSFRMAYTVMGDQVNLGSRLEGLTKVYGVNLIVSESTAERAPGWAFRRLDRVQVKGRDAPLWILEPLGRKPTLSARQQAWLRAYEAAVARYQQGDVEAAQAAFQALPDDDPPTRLYLARLAELHDRPTAMWDGVWRHRDK